MGKLFQIAAVITVSTMVIGAAGAADCPPPRCDTMRSTITVGAAPGGITDAIARALAKALSAEWGPDHVLVDNRAGTGGLVAAQFVSRSAADGGSALLAASSLSAAPVFYRNTGFSPAKDLIPVAVVASIPYAIAVSSSRNFNSMEELVASAKRAPDKMTYATGGSDTIEHLVAEMVTRSANMKMLHVPYKGSIPALTDLLAGQIDSTIAPPSGLEAYVRAGKVKVLATTGSQRSRRFPEVPTLGELKMQDATFENRIVLYVPAGTSPAALQRWNEVVAKAVRSPELQALIEGQSGAVMALSVQETRKLVTAEMSRLADVAAAAGIKPE